jgi:hypothetical protein
LEIITAGARCSAALIVLELIVLELIILELIILELIILELIILELIILELIILELINTWGVTRLLPRPRSQQAGRTCARVL